MAITRCRGCGSQKHSYDALCSSCGRGAWLFGLLQTGFIIVLVGGLVFGSGLLRWRDVQRYLESPGTPSPETGAVRSASTHRAPSARGTLGPARRAASSNTTRPATPKPSPSKLEQAVAGLSPCVGGDMVRYRTIATAHPEWDREALAAVTCRRVLLGLTSDQLRAARGEPDSVEREGTDVETWLYRNDPITLREGRVVVE